MVKLPFLLLSLCVFCMCCKKEVVEIQTKKHFSNDSTSIYGTYQVHEHLGIVLNYSTDYTLQIDSLAWDTVLLTNLANRLDTVVGILHSDTITIPLQSSPSGQYCWYNTSGFVTFTNHDSVVTYYKAVESGSNSCPWIFASGYGYKTQ